MDALSAANILIHSDFRSDQAEGAWLAADVFEALNGNEWRPHPRYCFDSHSADESSIASLEQALLHAARSDPAADVTGVMVFALGKRIEGGNERGC